MKVMDWIWKVSNKRPPKPSEAYGMVCGIWFYVGLILGGLCVVSFAEYKSGEAWWFAPLVVAVFTSVVLSWVAVKEHKQDGVYDAIAKWGLEFWENKAKRLGMIKDKE